MKITVNITRSKERKKIEINNGSEVQDLLFKLNLKPDTIIVLNNNQPVPIDDEILDGQELTIIQVSSGG